MKKTLIIILLSVLVCVSANSQSFLGVRGSFNMSSLSTGSVINRPGFSLGALYSTQLSDNWHLQPSLLYSFSSIKTKSGYKPASSAYTYSLEVPVMLSRRFGDEDISFGVDFGPFFKYGLHGNYWIADPTTGEKSYPDIFDHEKRFDVGPQAGFSMMVYGLYIAYSFQYGMIKPWDDRRGNNYSSSITFGYLFQVR